MKQLQDALFEWYDLRIEDNPQWLTTLSFSVSAHEARWGTKEWLMYLQYQPVVQSTLDSVRELILTIAKKYGNNTIHWHETLEWLKMWAFIGNIRAELSKYTGEWEYPLITKLDYVPGLDNELAIYFYKNVKIGVANALHDVKELRQLTSLIVYPQWHAQLIDDLKELFVSTYHLMISTVITTDVPHEYYAELTWLSWLIGNDTSFKLYEDNTWTHLSLQKHSLSELCLYSQGHTSALEDLQPDMIPKAWHGAIMASLDMVYEDKDILTQWSNVCKQISWPEELSFWLWAIECKQCEDKHSAQEIDNSVIELQHYHATSWNFFEQAWSWLIQSQCITFPVLGNISAESNFDYENGKYIHALAQQLRTMYKKSLQDEDFMFIDSGVF